MSAPSNMLRPVGMLEKLYTARKCLGIDHSVIVTATYSRPSQLNDTSLFSIFCAAISGLLSRHPSLCCSVEGEDTHVPNFIRLHTIKIKDVLQILDLERGENLSKKLEDFHDQPWPVGQKPLWKLIIMRQPQIAGLDLKLHVAFIYHHVIGDGLSGTAFHKSLLREILKIETADHDLQDTRTTIDTLVSPSLIEPVERLTEFPLSWRFLISKVIQEYAPRWLVARSPPLWAGLPIQTLEKCPIRSRVRIIMVDVDGVQTLLQESKKHDVTLTSLLTAAIVCTVAGILPEAPRLVGVTPYTLRRITGTSMDEMVNQTSGFDTSYSKDLLDRVRDSSNATERVQILWQIAGYFHVQMQEELARCPCNNLVGLLPYVSDHIKYYQKKFGQAREATFEMSNLGVFRIQDQVSATWRLESMTFTQGAQVMGPAINVKCVTVEDGPLNIAITWQTSVVREDIVDALAEYLVDLPRLLQSEHSNDMGVDLYMDIASR